MPRFKTSCCNCTTVSDHRNFRTCPKDILHTLSTMRTGMQVSILRRRGHVMSPVLVVKLTEHRTQHAKAGNQTATRPWSTPVGHCQPHAADIPSSGSELTAQQFFDQESAIVDRKIQGVCRGLLMPVEQSEQPTRLRV
jgi:hypothetical protein